MKKNEQNPNSKQRKGAFKKAAIIVGATSVMAFNTACNNQCPQQPKMKNIQRTEKIVPQNNKKELSEYELEQLSDLRDILSNMLGQRNEEARKVYNELDKYYLGDYEYDYDKMPKDLKKRSDLVEKGMLDRLITVYGPHSSKSLDPYIPDRTDDLFSATSDLGEVLVNLIYVIDATVSNDVVSRESSYTTGIDIYYEPINDLDRFLPVVSELAAGLNDPRNIISEKDKNALNVWVVNMWNILSPEAKHHQEISQLHAAMEDSYKY